MKYGDVVQYVRDGVALNALVIHSQANEAGERLILAYLDPKVESVVMSGSNTAKAVSVAFDVRPYLAGSRASQGWYELGQTSAATGPEEADREPPAEPGPSIPEPDETHLEPPAPAEPQAPATIEEHPEKL